MKKNDKILICPNCGNLKVKGVHILSPREESLLVALNKTSINFPRNYETVACLSCGWIGQPFKIKSENVKGFILKAPNKNFSHLKAQGMAGDKLSTWLYLIFLFIMVFSLFINYYNKLMGIPLFIIGLIGELITFANYLLRKH